MNSVKNKLKKVSNLPKEHLQSLVGGKHRFFYPYKQEIVTLRKKGLRWANIFEILIDCGIPKEQVTLNSLYTWKTHNQIK